MEKDADRFPETEGWGFEDFKIVNGTVERAVSDPREQCLSCHVSQKASDYVYSIYRD
jgi:nitrate reductase cytochrome c-type subunit